MPRNGSVDPRLLDRLKGAQRVGRGRGNHSALYWWMWEHYATLQTKAAQGGLPWDALLELFAELGLADADGRTPTRRTARDTYYRVCQDKRLRKPPEGDAKQGKSRAATYAPKPEGSTLPDEVQHPSGKPPDVRLAEAAARYAAEQGKRRFPTGKPRALRMPTLGGSAPATEAGEAGEGGVALPRPAMPKPRLIHHHAGKPDADDE